MVAARRSRRPGLTPWRKPADEPEQAEVLFEWPDGKPPPARLFPWWPERARDQGGGTYQR